METFPPIPLEAWKETRDTLHRFAQIVGKVRLAAGVRRNHWWHVPFHLTARGITTRPMGTDPIFAVDFDLIDHRLEVAAIDGRRASFPLIGQSVASFYRATFAALAALDVDVTITADPFDLPDATPFPDDEVHAAYDPVWVTRYFVVLSQVNLVLERVAAEFSGKISPVHHFWHTFDLAVTRFSDRKVEPADEADPVTREAYSREVISSGFWFGDDTTAEPAFYSYTAPEPTGTSDEPLVPSAARWVESRGAHLALLPYAEVRAQPEADRVAIVLEFYRSAYEAGARRAGWDLARLASPGGITDPLRARGR